ncbi:MAG: heavy-metal-associated domain-containing protein, partial [Bacteroidaceae bacterium]|nr:heavy-metal-associated domain-containing protein [Bacteroidaceae bacterium]
GVRQVSVDLSTGKATVEGDQSDEDVAAAVRRVGFDVEL